jgi:Putative auto-transporter adhesin, head GIN domain
MIFLYLCQSNFQEMKKATLLLITLLCASVTFAQKKEKIKGTKILKTEKHEIQSFQEIEIEDNLEVFLVKGDKNALEIETDDNLHTAIDFKNYGKILRVNTNKDITGYKKLEVRITYTDSLKLVSVKHEAKLNAISELQVKNITIKTFDFSKSNINANAPNFTLITNDKSEVSLNLKSDDAAIEMSKNSELKALINANKLKFDLYQKSEAKVEGDANELKLRLDNNANYIGNNLTSKLTNITIEGTTECGIFSNGNLTVSASGKSKLSIYGDPKIEIKKFADEAILQKKIK